MKKLNLKLLICFTAILFGTFLMTACGDVTVTFNSQPVQMGLNQEIDLKDYVTVSGAEIENVVFESSNSQIVFVTSRYTLASGSVSGTAIITAKGYDGFLEVVVSGQGVSFSAPTNVHYDEITSSLVWDNVYCGQTVANVYKLNITCNNVPQEEVYVNTNSYEIPNAGDYSVTVECVARAGIDASVASDVYSFKKLSAPYNLEYNNENKMLTWECQDSYMFYVKKDGVLSDIVYGTSYTIALAIEQTYSISVISVSEEQGENVFGSQSEVLTLTRLNAPTIEVNSGVISWQDTQLGVGEYLLKIYRQSEDVSELVATRQIAYNGTDYTYTFENFSAGKYFVTVEAVGLNEQYLTSGATQTQTLVKLEAPSLLFNKELQEISVNNFDATLMLDLELVIEKDTQINTQNISQEGKLVYDFSQSGIYNFSLINKAKSADQISSNPSQKVTVVKLGEITTLTQGVDNQGNYVISGLSQAYANNFVVQKIFNNATTSLTLTNENYGLVNELFASAGIYTIKITASGNDAQNFYVID